MEVAQKIFGAKQKNGTGKQLQQIPIPSPLMPVIGHEEERSRMRAEAMAIIAESNKQHDEVVAERDQLRNGLVLANARIRDLEKELDALRGEWRRDLQHSTRVETYQAEIKHHAEQIASLADFALREGAVAATQEPDEEAAKRIAVVEEGIRAIVQQEHEAKAEAVEPPPPAAA